MPKKKPKSTYGDTQGEQLAFMKRYNADAEKMKKAEKMRTRPEEIRQRDAVEAFIADKKIKAYKTNDDDVEVEKSLTYEGADLVDVLEPLIRTAFLLSKRPPALMPRSIASMLLRTHDNRFGCDVKFLPNEVVAVDRILAHLETLPLKMDPRVALAIARRTEKVLLARAGKALERAERQTDPHMRILTERTIPPPEPQEQALPAPMPSPPKAMICVGCGEPETPGHLCDPELEPPKEIAPPPPPAKLAPPPRPPIEESLPDPPREQEREPREPREPRAPRRVTSYGKVKERKIFYQEMGIGQAGYNQYLEPGTIVEILEPNERDRRDIEAQRVRDGRQLIMMRWWGGTSLVFGFEVDRVDESEFVAQERAKRNGEPPK